MLSFKEKKLVMKNAKKMKNTNIFIDEDFSSEIMEYRKQLWEEVNNYVRKVILLILAIDRLLIKG